MSNLFKLFCGLFLLQLSMGCGDQATINPSDLSGTSWTLQRMPGGLPAGVDINLQFEINRIAGKGVCNRYFSEYTMKGNRITFLGVAATEMMCMEHSEVETRYFQSLEKVETIALEEDQLTLSTPDGALLFSAAER
ncbi:META domain-containing protein [Flavilitoribacter nigricans]|uniref:DUF306 domain-containing protein n=1 Tax=Flavilitoribacter nigricans (strain ATCC 23147 / DSM 23189 / NBRC 102662 / NCIMB 1420 / SS-2) TaxID=1122177 RepID=A0A2D0NKP0_FLAN2|nr:META domain-containing protein [Flavilitoribacter nigricans]PHN08303.1 hypothetical protein CRP01_02985 [Flavilitoribacter nigricans DSM 23189 = NBRC 102662]